jgi:hypothetical protein
MGAKLDPFIKRLLEEQAEQLRFEPDEPVVLVKAGQARRLSKQAISDRQISALISHHGSRPAGRGRQTRRNC